MLHGSPYKFLEPQDIYAAGGNLWVDNQSGEMTVINGANGTAFKVITSGKYHLFTTPKAVQGSDIWVLGSSGRSYNLLVELNGATGAVVRTTKIANAASSLQLDLMQSMVASSNHVWISLQSNKLYEFNGLTGKMLRSITSHLDLPSAMVLAHGDLWAFNGFGGTLSEFSQSSGKFIRSVTLPGASDALDGELPASMAVSGSNLWVPSGTEAFRVSTSSGAVLSHEGGTSFGFKDALWVATSGSHIWFTNYGANSLTELVTSTGALVRVVKGKPYDFNDPCAAATMGGRIWVANAGQFQAGQWGSVTVLPAT